MYCPFCHLDFSVFSNTLIDETNNFLVIPSKGSLCDGYLLIVPKHHLNSMNELPDTQKQELINLIDKYRNKFFEIYNTYPILFEHGSSKINISTSSSSITHAHMHIVNHNFKNEQHIINELNLKCVNQNDFFQNRNLSYISYISPDNLFYISYNFKPISQQMRIYIANDLNINNDYNWKITNFDINIISTINKFKNNN